MSEFISWRDVVFIFLCTPLAYNLSIIDYTLGLLLVLIVAIETKRSIELRVVFMVLKVHNRVLKNENN